MLLKMSSSYTKYRHTKYLQLKKVSDLIIVNAETAKMLDEDKCSIFTTFTCGPI